jgi:hypothetical protein
VGHGEAPQRVDRVREFIVNGFPGELAHPGVELAPILAQRVEPDRTRRAVSARDTNSSAALESARSRKPWSNTCSGENAAG